MDNGESSADLRSVLVRATATSLMMVVGAGFVTSAAGADEEGSPPQIAEQDPLQELAPIQEPSESAASRPAFQSRSALPSTNASDAIPFQESLTKLTTDFFAPTDPDGVLTFVSCAIGTAGGEAVLAVSCADPNALVVANLGSGGFQYPLNVVVTFEVVETVNGVPGPATPGSAEFVLLPPPAPTAAPDSGSVVQGGTVDIPVALILANDTVGAGELSFSCACVVSPAAAGSALTGMVSGEQVLRFTATSTFSGTAEIAYLAQDEYGQSAESVVRIEVAALDPEAQPPVAANDQMSIASGATKSLNVLDNDVEISGGDLSLISVSKGRFGEVSFTPQGDVTYIAKADVSGTDVLLYEAESSNGSKSSALFIVTVSGSGTATGPQNLSVLSAGNTSPTATNPALIPNASLTPRIASTPAGTIPTTGSSAEELSRAGWGLIGGGGLLIYWRKKLMNRWGLS